MSTPHPATPPAQRPAHVPADLVIDWDFTAPPGGTEDLNGAWGRLHQGPDIVWTPRNGGHWIVTRAEDIEFVQKNHDPFSMSEITLPALSMAERILPLQCDPPEHQGYRAVINGFFTPKAINGLEAGIRALAVELIEGFRARGECEFIRDFAMKLPITIFMRLVDLPLADLDQLLEWTEATVRPRTPEARVQAFRATNEYLDGVIQSRRERPGTDLLSGIVHGKVFGRDIADAEMRSMLFNVLFGGLDTVASTMGFAANFLARSPGHQRQLAAEPALIPNAVEELMRLFAPSSTGRILTRDFDYKHIHFKQGDRVYVRPLLHGLDERRFAQPATADFRRKPIQHAAFGNGPHKCPGASLARTELRIWLEEWFRRIPAFRIQHGAQARFEAGMVNCVVRVPLAWDLA